MTTAPRPCGCRAAPPQARRIEHRVAGGDINPYLLLAAILGAALTGIEEGLEPPPPISGNAYAQDLAHLPGNWAAAMDSFARCGDIARIFAPELIANFLATKRQEMRLLADLPGGARRALYLDTV